MGFFYKECEVCRNKIKKCSSISDYIFGTICARCSKYCGLVHGISPACMFILEWFVGSIFWLHIILIVLAIDYIFPAEFGLEIWIIATVIFFILLRLFLGLIYWVPYKTRYKNIKLFPKKCKICGSKISIAISKYPAILGVYKSMCECCHTEYKIENKFEKIFMFNVKYLWIFLYISNKFILISALKTDKDSDYILILTFVLFFLLYRIVLKILPVKEFHQKK
ncbi:hypothetical protein [Campylobacter ureolyticus]|uniref:hypothetical protein n=1 Tax=Campylobacter ureolyticus TaxID=827 RepID=UPI0022B3908D|nr:hypothetical protein [Campylobacter ureolyticus]MCZ6169199.1 hypothetical protein [Campylobacter ureolyticus]